MLQCALAGQNLCSVLVACIAIMDRITPHMRAMCMQGTAGGPTGQASILARSTSTTKLHLTLGTMTVRAAFSHLPLLQSVLWAVQKVVLRPAPGNMATGGSVNDQFAEKVRDARGEGGLSSPYGRCLDIQCMALSWQCLEPCSCRLCP